VGPVRLAQFLPGWSLLVKSLTTARVKRGWAYPGLEFPALREDNLTNARLYATRKGLVCGLMKDQPELIGEIGVGLGDFSEFLICALCPLVFVGFDTFDLHDSPIIWGRSTGEIFGGKSHQDFYIDRVSNLGTRVIVEKGLSHDRLSSYADETFDLLYIDADHTHSGVQRDANIAKRKIKPDGTLIFNDYIMYDHLAGHPYGVVPVVNDLVVSEGWQVVGFALHQQLFCDIALRLPTAERARPRDIA
jgi:hypothetical protein